MTTLDEHYDATGTYPPCTGRGLMLKEAPKGSACFRYHIYHCDAHDCTCSLRNPRAARSCKPCDDYEPLEE